MTPERWRQITDIFHASLERADAEREAFLVEACRGDSSLRLDVDALLSGHRRAGAPGTTSVIAADVPLPPGTRFGSCRIDRLVGEGGMGQVYLAHDAELGRDVAIKVLPSAFQDDQAFLERLDREARALAALNHPNIAAIYGIEHADDRRGLVLEFVDGPTLAEILDERRLSLEESLHIARQLADALDSAHERGIVHRDVKPANIKFTREGLLKVLDFGLAKITIPAASDGITRSPSLAISATHPDLVVGTAAYMSPEQARAQPVDKRTDIWAFGCVLFEMLSGRAAFTGETLSDTMAAVRERDVPWEQLPSTIPMNVRQLLRRCLEKDPKRRLRDIGDARLDLDDAHESDEDADEATRRDRRLRTVAWTAIVVLLGVVTLLINRGSWSSTPPTEPVTTRFAVVPQEGSPFSGPSLSPDGRHLAFVARHDGVNVVWVRSLDAVDAQPVPGSEDARSAFWSPDSRNVAFFTGEGLKIVDDFGRGRVRRLGKVLADIGGAYGMMWCPDGRIVVGSLRRGLVAQSPDGGSSTELRSFDIAHGEGGQIFPTMLPDGHHFLYLSEPSSSIYLASLESKEATRVLSADSQALYVPPGYLLFVRGQTLFAQPFDLDHLKISGEPISIAEGVLTRASYGADFTVASNGVLAYRAGSVSVRTQLAWVDRTGKRLGTVGPPGRYANIELSNDGNRVVMEGLDPLTYTKDIWSMDVARGVLTQITFDRNNETFPIWSPDGRWIMFGSDRDGGWQLYRRRADGVGTDERVASTPESMVPQNWTPDGRSVVYLQRPANLGVLQLASPQTIGLIDRARFEGFGRLDGYGQVSPDGHWLLYGSNESGQWAIYLRRFPERDGSKWKISQATAISPRWGPDGREIFYYARVDDGELYAAGGQIVAVPITLTADASPIIGAPVPLFTARLLGGTVSAILWRMQYAVSKDGQRFLLNERLENPYARAPIVVATNWMAALRH